MVCAVCGGNFTVVGGKAPNVRYGCPNYRFRDTCTNKVSILRTRLEQQLIAALSKNLMNESLEEERIREFSAQLKARIEVEEKLAHKASSNPSQLREERADLHLQVILSMPSLSMGFPRYFHHSFLPWKLDWLKSSAC